LTKENSILHIVCTGGLGGQGPCPPLAPPLVELCKLLKHECVQICLLVCGVQMWILETVVNGEDQGHSGSCLWIESGEGLAPSLDRGTK
jgi:hypothetical protein